MANRKPKAQIEHIIKKTLDGTIDEVPIEGKFRCTFVFDGELVIQEHQLSESEIALMKSYLKEHGDQSAETVLMKSTIRNFGILAENTVVHSIINYLNRHKIVDNPNPPIVLENPVVEEHVFGKKEGESNA